MKHSFLIWSAVPARAVRRFEKDPAHRAAAAASPAFQIRKPQTSRVDQGAAQGGVHTQSGFTIVELLVVIGIIVLLLAILLPALSKARRAAQTSACLANLRTIGQAMVMYTSENRGWLPGSGWTSGAQFWDFSTMPPKYKSISETNCPAINESNDWVGPLAREMGILDPDIEGTDSYLRYAAYRNLGWTICPAARDVIELNKTPTSSDPPPGPGLSYCITYSFVDRPRSAAGPESLLTGHSELAGNLIAPINTSGSAAVVVQPAGYSPQLSKVDNSSEKIFAADGARIITFSSSGTKVAQPPAYVINGSPVGTGVDTSSYADMGAFGGYSRSFYRNAVAGNATATPPFDARIYGYRHGALSGFQPAGAYRTNVVFFDGHAETLDDVAAANPALWMPSGSVIIPGQAGGSTGVAGTKTVWADVAARYCPGVTGTSATWISP
jgi:prepilin-type N-terminal cleavage/methylation domain-containing protein/prepilin-type processing-associated H-X9-DG protein